MARKIALTEAQTRALRTQPWTDWHRDGDSHAWYWPISQLPVNTAVALLRKGFLEFAYREDQLVPVGHALTQAGREALVEVLGGPSAVCQAYGGREAAGEPVRLCKRSLSHILRGDPHHDPDHGGSEWDW